MHRATRYLAEQGIRQFLDIGTGIPTSPNLHEIAQQVAPDSRVVYVDRDPVVRAQSARLLNGTPQGRTAYVEADAADPTTLLASPALTATLDLTRPIALSLNAVLHFFPDARDPYALVTHLTTALAPGSHLVLSHVTADFDPEGIARAIQVYASAADPSASPHEARGRTLPGRPGPHPARCGPTPPLEHRRPGRVQQSNRRHLGRRGVVLRRDGPQADMTITYEWRGDFDNTALNALHAAGFGYQTLDVDWLARCGGTALVGSALAMTVTSSAS